jgi:hypothetical protein
MVLYSKDYVICYFFLPTQKSSTKLWGNCGFHLRKCFICVSKWECHSTCFPLDILNKKTWYIIENLENRLTTHLRTWWEQQESNTPNPFPPKEKSILFWALLGACCLTSIGCKKFLPTQGSLPFLTQVNDKGMDNWGCNW